MRRIIAFLLLLLILAGWDRTYAQADDPPNPGPVVLTDEQDEYPLGLHLEILEDPGGELTIEDVVSPEFNSRFVPSQVEVPNYGFTKSVYWIRLHLRNEAHLSERWLLDVGFANMHFVDLYIPLADGDGFEVKETGSFRSPETRDKRHPHIVLSLTIPSQSEQLIYLRFQNGAPMILPLTLWQPDGFADATLGEQILEGVFFGVMIGLLLYHLFLFFSLREATYLYLVLLLIGVAVFEAGQANYLELYVVPSSYQVKQHIIALATALLMISIVLLHDTFLTAKKLYPNIYRMDMVLIGIWGVLATSTLFTSYHTLSNLMARMVVVTLSASAFALLAAWPRGFRANRALIIAMLGLFASITLFIVGRLGVISDVTITEYLFRIGLVSIAVCWSLALADRVNRLKSETEETNLELRDSERRMAQILEGMPLGVVVYGQDQKPTFANRRVIEILGISAQGVEPDLSASRALAEAMNYYSIRVAGSDQEYPRESMPIYQALQGETASADDAEADLVDRRVPLEIWASPVVDDTGNVESTVVAFQDISKRKQTEAELAEYRQHLESLVEHRTAELSATNEWLSTLKQVRQTIGGTADLPQAFNKLFASILQLLDARAAFLLRWDGQGGQVETFYHRQRDGSVHVLNGIASIFENDTPLRKEIELGKPIQLAAAQVASLPASIGEFFQENGIHSLLLMPMIAGQSVSGVLGVTMPQPKQEITWLQTELVKTITIDLANLAESARLLDQAQALVVAEERNSLARELHDSVTQILFSASMLAEATPRLWERDQGLARLNMEKLSVLLRGSLAEMRSLLFELHSSKPQSQSLEKLLTTLVDAVRARTQIAISLKIYDDSTLPENVTQAFYRITREALNNAIVHSGATQVTISLLNEEQCTELYIQDNGRGFDPQEIPRGHLGIGIMTERATHIEGDLQIKSAPGQGTEIVVTWPGKEGKSGEHG